MSDPRIKRSIMGEEVGLGVQVAAQIAKDVGEVVQNLVAPQAEFKETVALLTEQVQLMTQCFSQDYGRAKMHYDISEKMCAALNDLTKLPEIKKLVADLFAALPSAAAREFKYRVRDMVGDPEDA